MTCNVGYYPEDEAASRKNIKIGKFYGDSISVESISSGRWDSYGSPIPENLMGKYAW